MGKRPVGFEKNDDCICISKPLQINISKINGGYMKSKKYIIITCSYVALINYWH